MVNAPAVTIGIKERVVVLRRTCSWSDAYGFQLLELSVEVRQDLVGKTSSDSAGEREPIRTWVADEQ